MESREKTHSLLHTVADTREVNDQGRGDEGEEKVGGMEVNEEETEEGQDLEGRQEDSEEQAEDGMEQEKEVGEVGRRQEYSEEYEQGTEDRMEQGREVEEAMQDNFLQSQSTEDTFQREVDKWEEFYDGMKAYLTDGNLPARNSAQIMKQADVYSLGTDGNLYYKKILRGGAVQLTLLVIRNYEDRLRICKDIHLNTGEESIHHRRDPMLELLGQQYYWKGQRRDVCECIATCEMCSLGLGGKRRSKPPRQKRDVRPPQKLLKLSTSPLTVTSSIATSKPPLSSRNTEDATSSSLSQPLPSTNSTESDNVPPLLHVPVYTPAQHSDAGVINNTHSNHHTTPLHTTTIPLHATRGTKPDGMSVQGLPSEPVIISAASGFQIFTTINEPCEETLIQDTDEPMPPSTGHSRAPHSKNIAEEEHFIVQGSSQEDESVEVSSAPSIYQLLFQLPSQPNTSVSTAVVESMHMALQHTTDPVQLSLAASKSLSKICSFSNSFSAIICPSRAAAYVTALAAVRLRQDPLSINPQVSFQSPNPPVVLHDTCCQSGSPKLCSALIGACNWNLGTVTSPMDKDMLLMAVASNRVTAAFHRPYSYPKNSSFLQLHTLCSVCHSRGSDIAVIVDVGDMPVSERSLNRITSSFQEMLMKGADILMLPDTEQFQGPPSTCVLVGKAPLLGSMAQQLPLLQSQLGFPLLSTAYDIVGTVVAFKTLQVNTFRSGN